MSQDPATDSFSPLRARGNGGATLEALAYGGHLLSWTPAGERDSRLFLSPASVFRPGTAVRGGVPVIFPQFAAHGPLPKHGFARVQDWQPTQSAGDGRIRLQLRDSPASRALWPHAFLLELELHCGGDTLRMELGVHNSGDTPFEFTVALHTYLRVADVRQARLQGLKGLRYLDAARNRSEHVEAQDELGFGPWTDRIYFDPPAELLLLEPQRRLRIRQEGFTDTVVWNPAAAVTSTLPDMAPDGWREMLCVEAATTLQPIRLAPGAQWRGAQVLVAE
ncbi:D-hexose-6-phosphate mutarotase [Solimonas sp. K1W22B-7]|uniref:D-hexose-6-phosphate mutarotase n=1 Tax=Solimonas sp. K1W22B-7 TaxID=2303331 RepID=UPI000E336717|nr:D-hexose-6-phosphate mutarotase [Solimonas sp. K1W22B-7]AXQ27695.1 D-hexose-6-phosphate mutarotase [Solimonas sp. K1W22B-7]